MKRTAAFGTSVFAEFSRLAVEHGAVNLGQGFPDFDGPPEVKAAAQRAIADGVNQYAVSQGALALRQAVSKHARRFYDQQIDAEREVVVTSGATEAIFDAVMAFVDPGDEVVIFEPYYDSYVASVQMAGGVCRFVRLQPPDATHERWWFNETELTRAFSARTACVIVNTPHNPTGKVFTRDELAFIGSLCARNDAVLVSDEVYEHLVFAPAVHVRPATLPGLFDRTLTISSGGKTFSYTGWKVGWATGPERLVSLVQKAHQWVTFATATPFQAAMAVALDLPDAYFTGFVADYTRRRDRLAAALSAYRVLPCEGTYFLLVETGATDDFEFCRSLIRTKRVAAIPPSAFYEREKVQHLARFAFCKTDAVLDEAAKRLATLSHR